MIEEADRDGDGAINEEEFIKIMKKTNLFGWSTLIHSLLKICDYFTFRIFKNIWINYFFKIYKLNINGLRLNSLNFKKINNVFT